MIGIVGLLPFKIALLTSDVSYILYLGIPLLNPVVGKATL